MSKENCKCDFTIQKLYKLLGEKEAENFKLREELKREMLDGVEWAGKAGKFAHDADQLRQQLKTARGLLEIIEIEIKNGYLYGSAVDRIREALSNLNGTKEEEHG